MKKLERSKPRLMESHISYHTIMDAFALTDNPAKPPGLKVSIKGWKQLIKIRRIDSGFLPASEAIIWERSKQMGLDAK